MNLNLFKYVVIYIYLNISVHQMFFLMFTVYW